MEERECIDEILECLWLAYGPVKEKSIRQGFTLVDALHACVAVEIDFVKCTYVR